MLSIFGVSVVLYFIKIPGSVSIQESVYCLRGGRAVRVKFNHINI